MDQGEEVVTFTLAEVEVIGFLIGSYIHSNTVTAIVYETTLENKDEFLIKLRNTVGKSPVTSHLPGGV